MRSKVYIETTIVSYLAARPSRDIIVAAHQQLTEEWWTSRRHDFDLFTSPLVYREASAGDEGQAERRLQLLAELSPLAISNEALELALDYRHRRCAWYGLPPDLELQASCKCATRAGGGSALPRCWIRTPYHLYP